MKGLKLFVWLALLTGIFYPLFITVIAELTMKEKARGTLVFDQNHQMRGSLLIGQKFEEDKYFWGRPSDYQTLPSRGSNLGPTSSILKNAITERKKQFSEKEKIPSDLLFGSASGIDPHITPEAALFQIERVSKSRNINREQLENLIQKLIEKRTLGFLGEPRINVFILNLKLDELK